jgi:hypothetical protein
MRFLTVLSLCSLIAGGSTAAEIPTLRCPAQPPEIRTYDLVERWRLDADDEDAPLIGIISQARGLEPGGDILLLDSQLCQVLVFSPDGELKRTLGREGDGPGEFRQPRVMEVLADGTIAVQTGWPTRLVRLDPRGEPVGQWSPRVPGWLFHIRRAPDGWIASGMRNDRSRQEPGRIVNEYFLSWFDDDGERVRDFRTGEHVNVFQPQTYDERQPYFPTGAWDLTSDGLLVSSAARDAYRLEFHDLDGRLVRVVERDFAPYRRTAADKEKIRAGMRAAVDGERQEIVFHLLETERVIAWLRTLPGGTLAVYTCYHNRDLPAGVAQRYDLHAPDGALLAEVRLRGEIDHDLDTLQVLPDGRAVILRNHLSVSRAWFGMVDENDPVREDEGLQVIVYDLVER